MSILKSLIDVCNDIKSIDAPDMTDIMLDEDEKTGVSRVPRAASYDSIAKQAKNSVMQFPFLASRTLSFDNMQMVAKAGERNFGAFLQTLFTMNMITNADSPQEFVRQFHQNSNNTVNGPSDVFTFIFNSAVPSKEDMEQITENLIDGNFTIDQVFNMEALNTQFKPKEAATVYAAAMEARNGKNNQQNIKHHVDIRVRGSNSTVDISGGGGKGDRITKIELPRDIYVDADAKKANELMPTLIRVRMFKDMGHGRGEHIDFIVGIKATIHPIASEDMINHLVAVFQDRGKLFKFLTWTTGEIAFFKDLIFGVDEIKNEIKDTRSGASSKWWTALKNIKAKRRMHKLTLREPILPNASLVISREEVDFIKANYGFDILDDDNASKLIKNLNILSFYVVDASSEVVYTFVDGADHFEINTFKSLERESGNTDRQFRDMLKAINKL